MHYRSDAILEVDVEALEASQELKSWLENGQFKNLKELLKYSTNELLSMDGFGYRMLREVYAILESNGCEDHIKES